MTAQNPIRLDHATHSLSSPVQVTFYRAFGHLQVVRDLDDRPILLVKQQDDFALLLAEAAKG